MRITAGLILVLLFLAACTDQDQKRHQISLNGEWEITKTDTVSDIPTNYSSKIPVPGLIDMAVPVLDDQELAYDNSVYWYRKRFQVKEADLVRLKINMAKYHTRVYVNGQFAGENLYNFTPALFDLKPFLKGKNQENELVISVGCRNNLPDTVINGNDFEKIKYIPGIYDEVKLITTGFPYISGVQIAPDIDKGRVRIVAELEKLSAEQDEEVDYIIRERVSGKVVAEGNYAPGTNSGKQDSKLDFTVQLSDVNLWTPETPFLYEVELETAGDKSVTRFGMRTFTHNPEGGPYLLNGEPYYMRGTNVCIHRFFEDPERDDLPWNDQWVTTLHSRFKEMNWNSIRYCIGLPPERWYEIADSLGFLIQNEYPIWASRFDGIYPKVTAEHLANEFKVWLPEHWNHPSVVIWDAQNETIAPETVEASKMVRHLDISNRPWENGWSAPDNPTDPIESHPYLFHKYARNDHPSEKGPLSDHLYKVIIPNNDVNQRNPNPEGARYDNPIIINEYAWLWLNRDGSTTTLTDRVYDVCFSENLTKEQRIDVYTKHMGMLTEYWRAHRLCAGVLHFCGLAYSRPEDPRGQTSDHFIDIKNLTFEPKFVQYVKPAFSPIGLMINFWKRTAAGGSNQQFEVYVINDYNETWDGTLKISLNEESRIISTQEHEITIPATGRIILNSEISVPDVKGHYKITAHIEVDGQQVQSIREFTVENSTN